MSQTVPHHKLDRRRLMLLTAGTMLAACAPASAPTPTTGSASPTTAPATSPTVASPKAAAVTPTTESTGPSPAAATAPAAAAITPTGESLPEVGLDVGKRAPAFTLTTLDGDSLTSDDLLAAKKPYILYFFATW